MLLDNPSDFERWNLYFGLKDIALGLRKLSFEVISLRQEEI